MIPYLTAIYTHMCRPCQSRRRLASDAVPAHHDVQLIVCLALRPSLSSPLLCLSGGLSLVRMHTMHVTHTQTCVERARWTCAGTNPYIHPARWREEAGYAESSAGRGEKKMKEGLSPPKCISTAARTPQWDLHPHEHMINNYVMW
jgi:hypothetical protein